MKRISTLLMLLCLAFSCNIKAQDELNILFVGNSYTHVNDLPELVKKVARDEGKGINIQTIAPGGARFMTHCSNTQTMAEISSGRYDILVIQGQSQECAFPNFQLMSEVYPYAQQIDEAFKAGNPQGRVIYYMTWGYRYGDQVNCQFYAPFCSYWTMSEELCNNYTMFANDFDSEVAPCGKAWQYAINRDSTMVLHSGDNSHPSMEGSLLNAYVIYNTIFSDTVKNGENAFLQYIANYTTTNNEDLPCNLETYFPSAIQDIFQSNFSIDINMDKMQVEVSSMVEGQYIIYDLNGKQRQKGNINIGPQSINIKGLKSGSYIFYIRSQAGSHSEKFIKL